MKLSNVVLGTVMVASAYVGVKLGEHLCKDCTYAIQWTEYPNKTLSNYTRPSSYAFAVCSNEGTIEDFHSGLRAGEESAKDSIIKSKSNPEILPLIERNMTHIRDSIRNISKVASEGFEMGKQFVVDFANNSHEYEEIYPNYPKFAFYWDKITHPRSVVKILK